MEWEFLIDWFLVLATCLGSFVCFVIVLLSLRFIWSGKKQVGISDWSFVVVMFIVGLIMLLAAVVSEVVGVIEVCK